MNIDESTIEEVKTRLINYDPEIVEIIQFGSSVYLPDLANDLDLLVFTKEKKGDCFDYLKELEGLDLPPDVDLILHKPGEPLDGLTLGVLGANKLIYGEGKFLEESTKGFNPSFDEAWAAIKTGKSTLKQGLSTEEDMIKDRLIRMAFNELSHAARMASLVYLTKEGLGWRGIEEELPGNLGKKFHDIFKTLHVEYFYCGEYPLEVESEFKKWEKEVKAYIKRLEEEIRKRKSNH